ncbi:MAG TPA: helix-turn-helix domain-containing protein [Polyangiaceae bacterium LLY-WYZ-15_(1-7)]|nr:helix-turn-helix domain-containing protein [Polyangiaceae bacterium LLY-WYZ-15_(1-7)]HJL01011.1 helix-turn-helix domain-containing protein [Polyangiaceae bacterium LLY-WYZ-15_(1-7)]HJL12147.1 helix-turn-helix domain-containing protein [Polyangiaceae bacterium LLY-WYZ-15_(1-7)]
MTDSRQRLILDAALRLFHHYGPTKTTVADIAREAQVGVGSVYLEFPSKNALLGALSRRAHGKLLRAEQEALEMEGRAEARLARALDRRFEGFVSVARLAHGPELFFCSRCDAIRGAHHAFRDRERELFAAFLAGAEELHAPDPRRAASALLRAYAAFAPPVLYAGEVERLREELPQQHALVLRGLLRR